MAFINGFPTENDIKLPLYTVEPEQLSDLVAVPSPSRKCWNVKLITNGFNTTVKSDLDIQEVSFPFCDCPCLFQRFNPYGFFFASEYSKKLYDWKRKYSQLSLLDKTKLIKIDDYLNIDEPIILDYQIGTELKIELPNNRQKLEMTYYYPELNLDSIDIGTSFSDFVTLQPEDMGEWRAIMPPSQEKPLSRSGAYIFSRHKNEFITTPVTRSWLLKGETYFCKGQTITIDEDILIGSLVFTYYDFTQEEIEFITSQIPQLYFYDYLDSFFDGVDSAILKSNPDIFNLRQVKKIDFSYELEYEITHRENSVEEIVQEEIVKTSAGTFDENTSLKYNPDPSNVYRINAKASDKPEILFSEYELVDEVFKFGTIIYANNNSWRNYDFNLNDEGFIHLDRGVKFLPSPNNNKISFNYYGNFDKTNSSQIPVNNYIFGIPQYSSYFRVDTFNYSESEPPRTSYIGCLEHRKDLLVDYYDFWNNYFTRMLYDSALSFPEITLRVGNRVETELYQVENTYKRYSNDDPYLNRYTNKKVFRTIVDIKYIDCDFLDSRDDRISPTLTERHESIEEILGAKNFTFDKHGQDHPTSKKFVDTPQGGHYEPNKYYIGERTRTRLNEVVNIVSKPIVPIYKSGSNAPNDIVRYGSASNIYLDKYFLDNTPFFETSEQKSKTIRTELEPATKLKTLRAYSFESEALTWIVEAHSEYIMANVDLEEIKKQVREIHLALDARKFAYQDETEEVSRVANLGYYIERLARILGISVNEDGSIRSIRQSKRIATGDTIPSGWNIAQWGRNNGEDNSGQVGGDPEHEKDGIAWEIKTNKFKNDDFTGETNAIEQGGYALVENIPQLLHIIMSDLDRAFDLQNAGANVLPTPNGGMIASYQGMNNMLLDLLYTLGQISRQTTGSHVLAMKNQAILQEILSGFGLPVAVKEAEISAGEGLKGTLPYPGFALGSPTINDLHSVTLANIAALLGSKIEVKEEEEEEEDTDENE